MACLSTELKNCTGHHFYNNATKAIYTIDILEYVCICGGSQLWCSHLRFIFYSGYVHGIWLRVSVTILHCCHVYLCECKRKESKLAFHCVIVVVFVIFLLAIRPGNCKLLCFKWTNLFQGCIHMVITIINHSVQLKSVFLRIFMKQKSNRNMNTVNH